MIGHRGPGELPVSHLVARIVLAAFAALLFLTAISLAVFWRSDELAFERTIADSVRSWLLP
jgi:hypothetical protein